MRFIGGKKKTIAGERTPQIALRNCSTEAVGKVSIRVILVKGGGTCNHIFFLWKVSASHEEQTVTMKDFSAFLGERRCKNWAPKIFSWKYLTVKACSAHFAQSTEGLISVLHLELLSEGVEGQWL